MIKMGHLSFVEKKKKIIDPFEITFLNNILRIEYWSNCITITFQKSKDLFNYDGQFYLLHKYELQLKES